MIADAPAVANPGQLPPICFSRTLGVFCVVGVLLGASTPAYVSAADVPAPPIQQAFTDEAELRARVRALRDGVRDVPFSLIIEELGGHPVLPWQGEFREELATVGDDVIHAINAADLTAVRVNEAGNAVETHVVAALEAHGFQAGRPAGPSGRVRSTGYPDLEAIPASGAPAFYIEVKTYSARTEDTTQRSFYLSPGSDFKVTRAAVHLLIAVRLERVRDGHYRATHVRWLDLSQLRCDLKHEFNASNRDLYRPEAGLTILEQTELEAAGQ